MFPGQMQLRRVLRSIAVALGAAALIVAAADPVGAAYQANGGLEHVGLRAQLRRGQRHLPVAAARGGPRRLPEPGVHDQRV
jgi:hypothetical protein